MLWMNKIVWWLIIMTLCRSQRIFDKLLLHDPQPDWSQISELIKLCFSERSNPIVITDDLVYAIYGRTRNIDHPNLYVINHNFIARQMQILNRAYPTYILSTNSTDQLEDLLFALKSTPTWKIHSFFFIVGTNEESCESASKILQISWRFDQVMTFYVCYELENKERMMLYTYNPFSNRAPGSWLKVESDKPNDRWSLYRQPYFKDEEACKNLTYDKTKFLDGYEVKMVSRSSSKYTQNKAYSIESLLTHNKQYQQIMFAKTLFFSANATPMIYYDQSGYWENKTAHGHLIKLMNGSYDFALSFHQLRYLSYIPKLDFINLNYEIGFMLITQRKSIVRTIDNYEAFLNAKIIFLTILILVVAFVIIVIYNDHDYGNGLLNIIRFLISSGVDAPLDKLPVRVIFLVVTSFVFVMAPTIQGQIFSYSTKPYRYYPQNLKDLNDFKFDLYYPAYLRNFISEQISTFDLNKKYLKQFDYHPSVCYDQVLNDSSNACIGPFGYQVQAAYDYGLHLAQKQLSAAYFSCWTRENWVLRDKFNNVASKFIETGFFDLWDRQQSKYIFKQFKFREIIENSNLEYDEITFENIIRIYVFISLYLLFSILIFVAEFGISKYKAARHRRIILQTLEERVKCVGGRIILIK